jgi:O-antigen/teichoic acid export membrane protein
MARTIPLFDTGSPATIPVSCHGATTEQWSNLLRLGRSRIARSIAWSVIGAGFTQGGSFLSSVVMARVLGKESFGQFALIQSTVTAFTCLAGLGLGLTATKYITEYRASRPETIGEVLGLCSMLVVLTSLCLSIVLAICAPMLALRGDYAGITAGLRLSTICVFFLTLTGYQIGILAGFENFRSIAWIGTICGLANPLLSWWGAAGFGMPGAVLAQCAWAVLLWFLYEIAVRIECRDRNVAVQYRGAWAQRSILTRVSIPAAACGMVSCLGIWGSNAILVRTCGYGELALFTAAGNMRSLVLFLPSLIIRVASPRLNYLFAAGDLPNYSRAFWTNAGVNSGLALFGASLAFFAGQRFLRLFGKEFAGSDLLLALILGSVVLEVIATNLYLALFAGSRFWRNLAIICLWTVLLLTASAFAASRYGATGLASANVAAWSAAAALYAVEARKQTRNRERS